MSLPEAEQPSFLSGKHAAIVLNYTPEFRGTREVFQLGLCGALMDRGCTPHVICPGQMPNEMRSAFTEIGAVIVEDINLERNFIRCFPAIRALVRKHDISATYLRFFSASQLAPWVLWLSGVRTLIFAAATSGTLTSVPWKRRLLRLRASAVLWPVTHVVAISNFVKTQFESLGFPSHAIQVIHNGVDIGRFRPDPSARKEVRGRFSISPEEPLLCTVSSLEARKNTEILIRACKQLAERGIPFRLLVAEDGPLAGRLRKLSHSLGIFDRVHWLGFQKSVNRLLQASDIFLLASTAEAFGNVIAEAMACGVPVVASRHGGIVDVVEHGKTGFLAEPLDPCSFAVAIERLIRDPALRKHMGDRGVDRVRQCFTVERMVRETVDLLEGAFAAKSLRDGRF